MVNRQWQSDCSCAQLIRIFFNLAVVTDLGCSTRPDGKTRDCLRQVECSDDPQSDRTFCPTRCDEAVESRVVRLANLVDSQPCRLGKTFGTKKSSGQFLLWVAKGCRARFRVSCSFAL